MTDKPDLRIVKLDLPGLQNVPAMLRKLADDIEQGTYGSWQEAALCLNAEAGFYVFGWGIGTPADACMLCAAGVQRFTDKLARRCHD